MDFRSRVESFEEADRRYAELAGKRDAGEISGDEFEEEARQLMVRDGAGRWWAKLGESGEWHHRDGGDWKPGSPPGYEAETLPPVRDGSVVPAARSASSGDERKRRRIPVWIPVVALLGILLLAGVVAATTLVPFLRGESASGGEGEPMGVGESGQGEEAGEAEGGSGDGAAFADVFVHRATGDTISANSTFIDNPLTNGNPDAVLIVTQNWNPGGGGGTYNDHEIGVWYESEREQWAIFNQDRDPMTEGAAFNVAVR
jgi:hypothetical protein